MTVSPKYSASLLLAVLAVFAGSGFAAEVTTIYTSPAPTPVPNPVLTPVPSLTPVPVPTDYYYYSPATGYRYYAPTVTEIYNAPSVMVTQPVVVEEQVVTYKPVVTEVYTPAVTEVYTPTVTEVYTPTVTEVYYAPPITVTAPPLTQDERITSDVIDVLANDPRLTGRIGVETFRNNVELSGIVTNSGQATIAGRDAQSVPGLMEVRNGLRTRVGGSR